MATETLKNVKLYIQQDGGSKTYSNMKNNLEASQFLEVAQILSSLHKDSPVAYRKLEIYNITE